MKLITRSILLVCVWFGVTTHATAAEAPQAMDVFTCNFNAGKDMDDLRAVNERFKRHLDKLGITNEAHYVWTPLRANIPYDHLWFGVFPDMAAFGTNMDVWLAHPDSAGIDDRFAEVADCNSGLSTVEVIYDGGEPAVTNPPAIVHSFACDLRDGTRMEDLADLDAHIAETLAGTGVHRSFAGYKSVPVTRSDVNADVYYFSVHDNLTVWTERQAALGSPAGQSLRRHFYAVLDCNISLFQSEQMVTPSAQ